jgi:hypothetical protein
MIRSLFDDDDAPSKMFRRSTLSESVILVFTDKSGGHHNFYGTESGLLR